MRHPQLVVYENPGSPSQQLERLTAEGAPLLGQALGPLAKRNAWLFREPRQRPACMALLREARPSVLVLKLERKLLDELALLAEVHSACPDVPVLVVNDAKLPAEPRGQVTALAYDLGARCVLFPPLSRPLLEEVVRAMMEALVRRDVVPGGSADA